MSEVNQMMEYAAMALLNCDEDAWDRKPQKERASIEAEAEDVLKSLGLPLETLAALRTGTWKAVPVEPTDDMFRAENKRGMGTDEIWHEMLAAAPSQPEDAK